MGTPPRTVEEQAPKLGQLEEALSQVMRNGLPVVPDRAPRLLVDLRSVSARSIDPDRYVSRVKALDELLARMLVELGEGPEARALQILFALHASERGLTLTERRKRAAAVFSYDPTHFRKRVEKRLIRDFAWHLHEDDLNYTPRTRYAPPIIETSGDTPTLTPADINGQEELVSRIWALVYELRAELISAARQGSSPAAGKHEAEVWVLARLLARINEYMETYGSRIAHGSAEYAVEGLIRLAGWRDELAPAEAAWLRLLVATTGDEDKDAFVAALRSEPTARLQERGLSPLDSPRSG